MPLIYAPALPLSACLRSQTEKGPSPHSILHCVTYEFAGRSTAPSLSLSLHSVRIGLRGRVPKSTLDKVFAGAVVMVLGHAGYIMAFDSTM